ARLLPVRSRPEAGLPRRARRQSARQPQAGHRGGPARGDRRGARGPAGRSSAGPEHGLQHQVEGLIRARSRAKLFAEPPVGAAVPRLGRGLLWSLVLICSGAAGCFPDRPEPEFERPSPPSPASEPTSAEPIEPTPLVPIVELPEPE